MNVQFNNTQCSFKNNRVRRTNGNILFLPFITIKNYFLWNYENLYFLTLAIFQLLTLGPLPSEWSPTGGYSTAIPLLLCLVLDIITDVVSWISNWKIDYNVNNRQISCLQDNEFKYCSSMNLKPGNIIKLYKDDIVPIDGIMIDHDMSHQVGKISLAPLNGESDIHTLEIPSYFKTKQQCVRNLQDISSINIAFLKINDYYPNNLYDINATLQTGVSNDVSDGVSYSLNSEFPINGDSFVVSNSIVKSDEITLWVLKCGDERKNFDNMNFSVKSNYSKLDNHIAKYMINYNTYLLCFLIVVMSTIKLIVGKYNVFSINTLFTFLFFSVQNWIIFNGIIPFSAKIMLLLVKKVEAFCINSYTNIHVINPVLIDELCNIEKIVTDKTGTLTKNELEFSKVIQKDSFEVNDIEDEFAIGEEFLKCLGLCIHQTEGSFSTIEDKAIRYRYEFLNSRAVQKGDVITLYLGDKKYEYSYVEIAGLNFTYDRKISSKIVLDNETGKYYIYSKGALSAINKKLIAIDSSKIDEMDVIISSKYPSLRLLACAYREITEDEINSKILISDLENKLNVLGIIGIKDNLQDNVKQTIINFSNLGINTCMCTGDRKITAIAIAKDAGIIMEGGDIIDFDLANLSTNCNNKTIVISGPMLHKVLDDDHKLKTFTENMKSCKNFIAYNLIPLHKSTLTKIFENANIKTLCIGDGFNDVRMFKQANISVSIKGNEYVMANSDFSIENFSTLWDLVFKMGVNYYKKNTILGNYCFYRSVCIVMCLITYNLINYNKPTISILNGFVIQAFNFLWCILPLMYRCFRIDYSKYGYTRRDFLLAKQSHYSNDYSTTMWNVNGFMTGIVVTYLSYKYFGQLELFSDLLGFIIILVVNIKFIHYGYHEVYDILMALIGPLNFLIYTYFTGNLVPILNILLSLNGNEIVSFICTLVMMINFIVK
jgi:magnesium-transporting ATPase (P-type)